MRYQLITPLLFILILVSCKPITYVDYNYEVITKKEFNEQIDKKTAFEIPAKPKRTKRLIKRTQFGIIREKEAFYKTLNLSLDKKITFKDYLIVDYYMTDDDCETLNIYNTNDSNYLQNNPKTNLVDHNIISQIISDYKYISLYPTNVDFKNGPEDLREDPDRLFEKMFFNYKYPCNSLVIIAPDGRFISYLGTHELKTKYDLLLTLVKNKNNDEWRE